MSSRVCEVACSEKFYGLLESLSKEVLPSTKPEVIRQAVSVFKWYIDTLNSGSKIFYTTVCGETYQVEGLDIKLS